MSHNKTDFKGTSQRFFDSRHFLLAYSVTLFMNSSLFLP